VIKSKAQFASITRALILLPLAIVAWFVPAGVQATTESGLTATVYDNYTGQYNQYNNAPPLPPTTPICLTTVYDSLDVNFDANPVCDIYDDFVVRFDGYITAPVTGTYTFYMHGDDGTKLYFDSQLVESFWRDTGNGGQTFSYSMIAGQSIPLLAWFYENGGGAWVRLEYLSGGTWTPVPSSWFSRSVVTPTTTTLAPYLNAPQNVIVTAVTTSSVSLIWDAPEQSNAEVERYAVFFSCDNWESAFAVSSLTTSATVTGLDYGTDCEFKVRADNDTLPVYSAFSSAIPATTATTTTTTTTTTTSTTTTTTTVAPTTTEEPTTTSAPQEETTTSAAPGTTVQTVPETTLPQSTTIPKTTTTQAQVPITEPPMTTTSSTTKTSTVAPTATTSTSIPEIKEEMTQEEALTVATQAETLNELSKEELVTVFENIDISELDQEEVAALVETLSEADDEVKEAFEETVNVFDDPNLGNYVPSGSNITVNQRRVIIVGSVVLSTVGSSMLNPPTSGGTGGSTGGGGGGGGGSDDSGRRRRRGK